MKIIERVEDYHIIFYEGITINKEISVFSGSGVFDLTGFEASLTGRVTRDANSNQILFTSESNPDTAVVTGTISLDEENGKLTLTLNKTQANNLENASEGVFDLTIVSNNEKRLLMRGTYEVESVI